MSAVKILRKAERTILPQNWGKLVWFASRQLSNTEDFTLGQCFLKPGCSNPRHSHPNCAETLHVLRGAIMHTVEGGREERLSVGDTITVPPLFVHQARNVGDVEAVLFIAFSSADRQVQGE